MGNEHALSPQPAVKPAAPQLFNDKEDEGAEHDEGPTDAVFKDVAAQVPPKKKGAGPAKADPAASSAKDPKTRTDAKRASAKAVNANLFAAASRFDAAAEALDELIKSNDVRGPHFLVEEMVAVIDRGTQRYELNNAIKDIKEHDIGQLVGYDGLRAVTSAEQRLGKAVKAAEKFASLHKAPLNTAAFAGLTNEVDALLGVQDRERGELHSVEAGPSNHLDLSMTAITESIEAAEVHVLALTSVIETESYDRLAYQIEKCVKQFKSAGSAVGVYSGNLAARKGERPPPQPSKKVRKAMSSAMSSLKKSVSLFDNKAKALIAKKAQSKRDSAPNNEVLPQKWTDVSAMTVRLANGLGNL